ncbi:MAG: hypothetical protein IK100_08160 [Muribaculaceae bacterium]|nr:hypothetical protein [Muribaculaceae bacterium]
MKIFKYFAIALLTMTMVACSDDEPNSTYTRDFNMIYPVLPAGHKKISKIEQTSNKASIVATANYDGDHLKSIKVVTKYEDGTKNEENIHFDYTNGAIFCDRSIQDVTYAFEVNSLGAITRLKNVISGGTSAALQYNNNNELEIAQLSNSSSTSTTKVLWQGGNLVQWENFGTNKQDSVVYEYGVGAPLNKGCIDVVGNDSFAFTKFVCAIMRNAGYFGATSVYLPTVIKKDRYYADASDPSSGFELKRYNITYEFDSEGYVKSYTTNEVPKYTVNITYK